MQMTRKRKGWRMYYRGTRGEGGRTSREGKKKKKEDAGIGLYEARGGKRPSRDFRKGEKERGGEEKTRL